MKNDLNNYDEWLIRTTLISCDETSCYDEEQIKDVLFSVTLKKRRLKRFINEK